MLLTVDIGNTSIRIGSFEGSRLVSRVKLASERRKSSDEYAVLISGSLTMRGIDPERLEGAMLASVVPQLTYTLTRALESLGIEVKCVGAGIKTGLNIRIDSPGILGADIVAGTVAATSICEPPLILVDLGTATTLTAINRKSELVGCVIAPGVRLSLDALCESCSLLHEYSLKAPERLLGTNSADSVDAGVVLGAAMMLDGFIARAKRELGEPDATVIATGGLAQLIIPLCESEIRHEPDLTLQGLRRLYEINAKSKRTGVI